MKVRTLHSWPATADEAEAVQDRLRPLLDLTGSGPAEVGTVAGLDVSYEEGTDRLAAAVVVLDAATLRPVEESVVIGTAAFPYVPGLFAFRELPTLVEALERLTTVPDLLVCDGHGLAHPRRFGLACHLGVLTGLPSLGVGKTRLVGSYDPPGEPRGSMSDLVDAGEVVGRVLRTQDGVRPVFVSAGHRIDLDTACRHVLALAPDYRLPETTRRADRLSRQALAGPLPA
ncbi:MULTISPECIES: deoxyribonuclease V [Thermomonospora]|uniref:Endonuclease V n=1 Tax=Thermomonospora cellulosilytica TaxID=1411118 RepID=A0A7W3RBI3_9ACTN|nr:MULTISPECIES: deoxyribonuclease V [Thermomonospora]MBA9007037.1 deoxyribonuclease V [Thermomonospora cellulosilytica]